MSITYFVYIKLACTIYRKRISKYILYHLIYIVCVIKFYRLNICKLFPSHHALNRGLGDSGKNYCFHTPPFLCSIVCSVTYCCDVTVCNQLTYFLIKPLEFGTKCPPP